MKESNEIRPIAPQILDYLHQVYILLDNDYREPDGKHGKSCSEIYNKVAELCKSPGYAPKLIHVRGKKLADGMNTETFIPKRYQGRVQWEGHLVCVVDNLVLDPLVGFPLSMAEYASEVFESPVDLFENYWDSIPLTLNGKIS